MPKRLNGSSGTGKKIIQNMIDFSYRYRDVETVSDKDFYTFTWTFGNQTGTAVISLTANGFIDQSSTLNCDTNCHDFQRPLGAYNDNTLYGVFEMMLDSQNIIHK